jgi:RHS repeat-associated protein
MAYFGGDTTPPGTLSTTDATTGVNNRAGYAGYQFSPATQQYHVRHRAYDPLVGTWGERDPMEYHDGADLYMYVRDNPVADLDFTGMASSSAACGANTSCANDNVDPRLLPRSVPAPRGVPGLPNVCNPGFCENLRTRDHMRALILLGSCLGFSLDPDDTIRHLACIVGCAWAFHTAPLFLACLAACEGLAMFAERIADALCGNPSCFDVYASDARNADMRYCMCKRAELRLCGGYVITPPTICCQRVDPRWQLPQDGCY